MQNGVVGTIGVHSENSSVSRVATVIGRSVQDISSQDDRPRGLSVISHNSEIVQIRESLCVGYMAQQKTGANAKHDQREIISGSRNGSG
jgi:hypothetical protein